MKIKTIIISILIIGGCIAYIYRPIYATVHISSSLPLGYEEEPFITTNPFPQRKEFKGAQIYINGQNTGLTTPSSIELVSDAEYSIRLVHPDFEASIIYPIHKPQPFQHHFFDIVVMANTYHQSTNINLEAKHPWIEKGSVSLFFPKSNSYGYSDYKLVYRTREDGNPEYRINDYTNGIHGTEIIIGSYYVSGLHFNGKLSGQNLYLNVPMNGASPIFATTKDETKESQHYSSSIVGHWIEHRADDPSDNYLLSHFEFMSTGYGSFYLTEGNEIREKRQFSWEQRASNISITMSDGDRETLSFNNGLLVETSAFGQIVYRKKN